MKIVFLDRDGTFIQDPLDERVDREDKIELFPDTIDALKYLAENDFAVVVVTNQAGISEGRINKDDFHRIHRKVLEMLEPSGVKILKTFMCPHDSNDGCDCRKPKPKMLLEALDEFGAIPEHTYYVGDNVSDIEAGINAGMKTVLVETARNKKVVAPRATYSAPSLLDAVQYIVSH